MTKGEPKMTLFGNRNFFFERVFLYCLSMSASTCEEARKWIGRFLELRSDPSTRDKAYAILCQESGLSVDLLRQVFHREGLTEKRDSLHLALPPDRENALVVVCLIYSRAGNPLTILDFRTIASKMAGKSDGDLLSRKFVSGFCVRHADIIVKKTGTITSKKRCYEHMVENTLEFIDALDDIMALNIINKNNIVVFDETIIGDDFSVPVLIGEKKDSAGGNLNTVRTRELALGCYIPFSMPDGSTPFRVFIFRSGPNVRGNAFVPAYKPKKERGLRGQPERLFLQSEKGYLTIELFRYIMERFIDWWTHTRPGLDCFMICDNLSVHRDYDIVEMARSNGIHFVNIMPGSSHWFQVHDQEPFGILKRKISEEKKIFSAPAAAKSSVRQTISMAQFYQAEAKAFEPHIVAEAFRKVGLSPWSPEIIKKNVMKIVHFVQSTSATDPLKLLLLQLGSVSKKSCGSAGRWLMI